MTEDQQTILSNTLNQACEKFGLKAALLVCFEGGTRTIIPIGQTLDLCLAAESVGRELHDQWIAMDEAIQSGGYWCAADYTAPFIPPILH